MRFYIMCKDSYPMEELNYIFVFSNNHDDNNNGNKNENGNIDNNINT